MNAAAAAGGGGRKNNSRVWHEERFPKTRKVWAYFLSEGRNRTRLGELRLAAEIGLEGVMVVRSCPKTGPRPARELPQELHDAKSRWRTGGTMIDVGLRRPSLARAAASL